MKLNLVSLDELSSDSNIDLFIIGLGYEYRASYLANILKAKDIKLKYCIKLVDDPNPQEELKIKNLGFIFIKKNDVLDILQSKVSNILVDFSVMMKSLYAEILTIFNNSEHLNSSKIYFSYSHAKFEQALERDHYVESIKPILLTDNKVMDDISKTKLIISLGYERLSAIGVIENLEIDYKDVIVLINKTENNTEHYNECLKLNSEFLELLDQSQIIEMNFYNFNQLSSIMDSILYRLKRQNYRVIISPLSVKTFSFYAMELSLRHDNVIFYNVTSINKSPHYKKKPNEKIKPLIYSLKKESVTERII